MPMLGFFALTFTTSFSFGGDTAPKSIGFESVPKSAERLEQDAAIRELLEEFPTCASELRYMLNQLLYMEESTDYPKEALSPESTQRDRSTETKVEPITKGT
jgi:hypothetical protein